MKKLTLLVAIFVAGSANCYAQHVHKPSTITPNTHNVMQEKKDIQQEQSAQHVDSTTYKLKTGKVGESVVKAYKTVEDGVVGGYKKVEEAFVHAFLEKSDSTTTAQAGDSTCYQMKTGKMGDGVVKAYKAIENGTVSAYKTVENGVVSGYKKVENAFVEAFLEKTEPSATTDIETNQ